MHDRPGWRPFAVAIIVAFGCNFQLAYQICIVNTAEAVFKQFLNESYALSYNASLPMSHTTDVALWTVVVNIFYVGECFGVLLVPMVADRYGRKGGILLGNIPSILGTVLCYLWSVVGRLELLPIGRFIIGMHAGLVCGIQSIYLTEISRAEYRGIIGSFPELFLVSLMCFSISVGLPDLLGNQQHFGYLLLLPGFASILQTMLLMFCPESPKHLLHSKFLAEQRADVKKANLREKQAAVAVIFYCGLTSDSEMRKEWEQEAEEQDDKSIQQNALRRLIVLFRSSKRSFKIAVLVGIVAMVSQILTGIVTLESFSTEILVHAGVGRGAAEYSTVGLTAANAVSACFVLSFVDKVSRRKLLLTSIVCCAACNCFYVAASAITAALPQLATQISFLLIVNYVLFMIAFSFGAGPIPWFLTTEMVPHSQRSLAQSIVVLLQCITQIFTGFLYYPLSQAIGVYSFLVVFVAPSLFCIVILYRYMPETKGKSVSDIVKEMEVGNDLDLLCQK